LCSEKNTISHNFIEDIFWRKSSLILLNNFQSELSKMIQEINVGHSYISSPLDQWHCRWRFEGSFQKVTVLSPTNPVSIRWRPFWRQIHLLSRLWSSLELQNVFCDRSSMWSQI
jgi:hypothetical protein